MMKMPVALVCAFLLAACAPPSGAVVDATPAPVAVGPTRAAAEPLGRPYVLPPGGGERMDYCARPVTLWMKVDSVPAPGTRMIAGTAELRGDEGQGRHPDADEVLYIIRGSGHAVFGSDTLSLQPGSVMFVPQGIAHQIVSTGKEPMEYLFVIGPRTSAQSFRRAASRGCSAQPE
jgi:mannose-6-phosphate isomerase-like protein (cupin superfamily)